MRLNKILFEVIYPLKYILLEYIFFERILKVKEIFICYFTRKLNKLMSLGNLIESGGGEERERKSG